MSYHQAVIEIARFLQGVEWYGAGIGALWALSLLCFAVRSIWEHSPACRHRQARERAARDARVDAAMQRYLRTRNRNPAQ